MDNIVRLDVKMKENEAVALYGLLKGVKEDLSIRILEEASKASKVSDISSALVAGQKGVDRLMNELELVLEV